MTTRLVTGRALASAFAMLLAAPACAVAGPTSCPISPDGAVATCSMDQSDGMLFVTVAPLAAVNAGGVTMVNVKNLTVPVAPFAGMNGVALYYDQSGTPVGHGFGDFTPYPALDGLAGPKLTVTTDASQPFQITGPGGPPQIFPSNAAILVYGHGGNGQAGGVGIILEAGADGGAGNEIVVNNNATLSLASTAQAQTRAVVYGQQDTLNGAIAGEAKIESALRCLNKAETACTAQEHSDYDYFHCYYSGGLTGGIFGGHCVGGGTIDDRKLLGEIRQAQVVIQNTVAYYSGDPAPAENGTRVGGAIFATSVGGNGAGYIYNSTTPVGTGNGGTGGAITITNNAAIFVTAANGSDGAFTAGISAVSQGGNGGQFVSLLLFGGGVSLPIGRGGDGGVITVVNSGAISTTPVSSPGIFAQSIGGAGTAPVFSDENITGVAGMGGVVTVGNSAAIATTGDNSDGIFAQSVGGQGSTSGKGGQAGTVTVNVLNGTTIATAGRAAYGVFANSLGGHGGDGCGGCDGGDGGDSNQVTVVVDPNTIIHTKGIGATAVFGLSQAGIGGSGGSDSGLFWAEAGGGGNGGVGKDILLTARGTLITEGDYAYGVFAQSLGGTGGYGGGAAALVASSGSGGGGAPSGNAFAENDGGITTSGQGAYGIFVQSVAGLGGDAGSSGGLVALGGDGGNGAASQCADFAHCLNGGNVVAQNYGSIATTGFQADGILIQSIGGGGGNGGHASGIFTFGGSGGAGGDGGTVLAQNHNFISATGDEAFAIFAQSIGGGGGNGGDATSFGSVAAAGIGGSGGTGGDGHPVTVDNLGIIQVAGYDTTAIFAQSIGGGGGHGGTATVFSASGASFNFAVGGSGGGGGDGEAVIVTNGGGIAASGDFSDAIVAQSVGGGGGAGGSAYSTAAAAFPDASASVSIAVGGSGGDGGMGGTVFVNNTGSITTLDWDSRGIFAQSIGGGGGNGGLASAEALSASDGPTLAAAVAVGGHGGGGGSASDVTVLNSGSIMTFGEASHAIFAQSVGGGGGSGGDASVTTYTLTAEESANVNIAVGGNAGNGGNGSTVNVTNTGTIVALGNLAYGIVAQSIGGGGGNGGAGTQEPLFQNLDLPTSFDKDTANKPLKEQAAAKFESLKTQAAALRDSPSSLGRNAEESGDSEKPQSVGISVSVGGSGGLGGFGDAVVVTNSKEIITGGFMGVAVLAQSIGGGGGIGGGGDASGSGDINVGAGVGGAGGSGNKGGTVTVTNTGDITTFGDLAFGILAQSVGGGGGLGGAGGGTSDGSTSLSLSIGGSGGGSGNGLDLDHQGKSDADVVTVVQNGNVVTFGNSAIGVFAQSIGGGGGAGGAAQSANTNNISVGGNGGGGGDGKLVDVTVNGSIATVGDFAHGVMAQSIGGGGGLAGGVETATLVASAPFGVYSIDTGIPYNLGTLGFGGSGGNAGSGGDVTIHTAGTISTSGRGADGIFAQSIGGSGGSGGTGGNIFPAAVAVSGSNGGTGTAGKITITHAGSIFATGVDAHGILAQSEGGSDQNGVGGDITITLIGGTISGGTGGGAGIFVAGGHNNTINNQGGVITALSSIAIVGGDGNDTVENNGLVHGDVGLGAGANSFHNALHGTFESGDFVYIRAGSTLLNDGTLSPFGMGTPGVTNLSGNLTQSATGTLLADVNFKGGPSDVIAMDGTATLAGKALLTPHHVTDLVVDHYVTVLTAAAATMNGIGIDDTLVVNYDVRAQGGAFQIGVIDVDFTPTGVTLTSNQTAIGQHLQAAWAAGGTPQLQPLLDYFAGLTNPTAYAATIASLDPGTGQGETSALLFSGMNFTSGLMSCPGASDPAEALSEHECYWGKIGGGAGRQDTTATSTYYRDSGVRFQMGRQVQVAPGWFAGISAGFEQTAFNAGAAAHGDDRAYSLGAVGKYQTGSLVVALGADVVFGDGRLQRSVTFPTNLAASSAPQRFLSDVKLRVSDVERWGWFYAKPSLDADFYYVNVGAFHERGAGALNIVANGSSKSFGSGSLGLEFGAILEDEDHSILRPYASGGVTVFSDNRWDMLARFEGSPAGVAPFTISNTFPGVLGRLTGGFEASLGAGTVKAEYETHFSSHYSDQTGSLKLELRL
jgi:hypothetical protein